MKPSKRAGYWYLIRRVPKAAAHLDPRISVRITTKIRITDDPRGIAAASVVARLNADLEAYWRALIDGQPKAELDAFRQARATARSLGFDYAPASELRDRTIDELLARIEALERGNLIEKPEAVAAALGGIERPVVKMSNLVASHEAHEGVTLSTFSPNQLKKWRNPKSRAVANFIAAVSDKPITEITRDDALDFREYWQGRIKAEGLDIGTANKDIGHLNNMFMSLNVAMRLGLESPFSRLRIGGEESGQRTAYPAEFVQNNFLKDGMFEDLNEEARRIIYLVADTGLRLSEACNLTRADIHLNAPVPYVSVAAHGRRLKTSQSARDIPLVGAALAALKAQPDGFPRYRDKEGSLSALVNKALDARDLRPLTGQTLYSLRHTFEDRLTAVEAPEKLIAALMGHKYSRPKYGAGPSLAQKREWLLKIAFRPPSIV